MKIWYKKSMEQGHIAFSEQISLQLLLDDLTSDFGFPFDIKDYKIKDWLQQNIIPLCPEKAFPTQKALEEWLTQKEKTENKTNKVIIQQIRAYIRQEIDLFPPLLPNRHQVSSTTIL